MTALGDLSLNSCLRSKHEWMEGKTQLYQQYLTILSCSVCGCVCQKHFFSLFIKVADVTKSPTLSPYIVSNVGHFLKFLSLLLTFFFYFLSNQEVKILR